MCAYSLGMTLCEYADLPGEEQKEIESFMLNGPSPLRQIILIGEIKNMLESHFTQKPVRSDAMPWLDGLLQNPAAIRERREERAKERRLDMHLAAVNMARRAK